MRTDKRGDAFFVYARRVPQRLPRFDSAREEAAWRNKLARILLEAGEPEAPHGVKTGSDVGGGDPARLRGLPAIGRNVAGAIPGTDPLRALIAKEDRNGRRRRR